MPNSSEDSKTVRMAASMVPTPDPTILTTAALKASIDGLKELVITRLDAMDKAMDIFSANITRVPTDVDKQVSQLRDLVFERFTVHDERFISIQTQFKERDVRVDQTAKDTKVAVDAALQAAEKAVGKQNEASSLSIAKSEAATNKNIDQLGELIKTNQAASNDKMDDMKERLLRLEGGQLGAQTMRGEQVQTRTSIIAIVSIVVGLLIGLGGIVVAVIANSSHALR